MSRMSEMHAEIAELIEEDRLSFTDIAKVLGVPIEWVNSVYESMDFYDDSMDGDHASALASAGWGTDEDYGYAGEY